MRRVRGNDRALHAAAERVRVAIVSTPPFAWFGPDRLNIFVTYAPFVPLPAVLVVAALMSHVLVFRRLLGRPGSDARRRPA